ncbi:hypothetical protein NC652_015228 [Populus alba x Populus x berolinensis]|nr:hypothetical protein NC652_015228 [Populus alba x Populus x berolinensis]
MRLMAQTLLGRTLHMMERRAYLQLVLCLETKWNSLFCLIVFHQIGILEMAVLLAMEVQTRLIKKRMRRAFQSKTFKVEMSFAAKIPMQAIAAALRGQESENSQEALRVLDIILRQHAAKQGCLLVRQSFFHNDPKNYVDLGGGVLGCRGFHSSFRTSQDGSTTTIIQPGPLIDFLIANQNVSNPFQIDWAKAKRTLKNLRIRVSPTNQEYRITGLSENTCKEQMFSLKSRASDGNDVESVDITVYDYFVNHRSIDLRYSGDLPCINVGKPKRPTYIPVELCSLLPLQRYIKALTVLQRSQFMKSNNYAAEPMLRSCGITISSQFTQVQGRVLTGPKLKAGNGEDVIPRNGRWNFNHKKFFEPSKIENWAVVNFSARCDVRGLVRDLIRFGEMKGILISDPVDVVEENGQFRRAPPLVRVEKMFEQIQKAFPNAPPRFLVCLLPDRTNSDIYGPWKRKNLAEYGIFNQCLAPTRVNEQYILNVLLKINAKKLASAFLVIGAFCAVSQSPKVEMVLDFSFYNNHRIKKDDSGIGIVAGLLIGSSGQTKTQLRLIIFRHLLSSLMKAGHQSSLFLLVAQKNHHTKFFQDGTVIDTAVCHHKAMISTCVAHAGMIGNNKAQHIIHVILGFEIGFSADDLQRS